GTLRCRRRSSPPVLRIEPICQRYSATTCPLIARPREHWLRRSRTSPPFCESGRVESEPKRGMNRSAGYPDPPTIRSIEPRLSILVNAGQRIDAQHAALLSKDQAACDKVVARNRRAETVTIASIETAGLFAELILPEHLAGVGMERVHRDL